MINLSENCIEDLRTLITKVLQVVNNNDWPTDEGQNREGQNPCIIEFLCIRISREINGKT